MLFLTAIHSLQPVSGPLHANSQAAVERRIDQTMAQLSTDEKITMISDCDGYFTAAIPRLGIPRLKCSDGPVGLRLDGPTTAYPLTVGLAASFDTDLAYRFGVAAGRDARARNVCIWWAPGVNLARIPQNGRNFEYLGEDPYLASKIVVPIIQGVQGQGVAATVKHYAGNEWENDRGVDSANEDERTLRELYLKPFEAAIKDGHAWCVMCAYNRVNGVYCSQNQFLLDQVLKKDWGFKGMVVSDYGATHSTLPALLAGLDVEMPGENFFSLRKIRPLIDSRELPIATLDDKVRRILRVYYSMGFLDRPQLDPTIAKDDPSNERTALQVAREGVVLLKNHLAVLPIWGHKGGTILVVGPNADPAVTGAGGSSYTTPAEKVSLLEAIEKQAGSSYRVVHRTISFEASDKAFEFNGFTVPGGGSTSGLHMEHFPNMTLTGEPDKVGVDKRIDIDADDDHAAQHFSVRWTADVHFPTTGRYVAWSRSDDGIRVFLNDRPVIQAWNNHGSKLDSGTVSVEAGQTYRLRVEYYQDAGASVAKFGFVPEKLDLTKDLPLSEIRSAHVVIAAVGFSPNTEGEGQDRPFELPVQQEQMLETLVKLNPNTVVVNNSGAGVDMSAWAYKAGAIVQAWYPGGIGNRAIAEILFGITNPSGKLPTTFPRTLVGTYYEHAYPPINHAITYKEGLFMGYRWFDAHRQAPLFPFGFGLSYTTFQLSEMTLSRPADGEVVVRVRVRNTGRRQGAEIVQVYVRPPGRDCSPGPRTERLCQSHTQSRREPRSGDPGQSKRLGLFRRFETRLANGSR